MAMDALTLVREDHRKLERLLERFDQSDGDEVEERAVLLDQLRTALRRHVDWEESFLYPIYRERAKQEDVDLGLLDQVIEQHRLVERLADELAALGPGADAFAAKMRMLTEQARNHLDTEDAVLLTAIEDLVDDDTLLELGRRMEQRERVVAAQQELADTMSFSGNGSRRVAAAFAGLLAAGAALFAVLARRRRRPRRRLATGWRRIGRR
jgi:hemerythrin-like domain-containing protein